MPCEGCNLTLDQRKEKRGYCPICGWNLNGFSPPGSTELHGWCSNRLCQNSKENNPGGIQWTTATKS